MSFKTAGQHEPKLVYVIRWVTYDTTENGVIPQAFHTMEQAQALEAILVDQGASRSYHIETLTLK